MRWMRWERWKKNNSPHFTARLTKIHRIWFPKFTYSIWLKFTRNNKDLSDRWRSGISIRRHAVGQRFEPVWGGLFFVRILRTRWKKNNSPRFTGFTAKRCKKYAVKFFHRISPHFLRKFTTKPRPGMFLLFRTH